MADLSPLEKDLLEALEALDANSSYKTPVGDINCRYCDLSMDDLGTGKETHAADCEILKARAAIARAMKKDMAT